MLDAPYTRPDKSAFDIDWIGVKASQFSFSRLHKADPVLGVDMSSTGEVGCIGDDFSEALLSAMIATGFQIPQKGVMFSSGAMKSKVDLLESSRMLFNKGYKIYATLQEIFRPLLATLTRPDGLRYGQHHVADAQVLFRTHGDRPHRRFQVHEVHEVTAGKMPELIIVTHLVDEQAQGEVNGVHPCGCVFEQCSVTHARPPSSVLCR